MIVSREDVPMLLLWIGASCAVIAWHVYWLDRRQAALLAIVQEQHIAARSLVGQDPVVRPSTAREKSHEGTAG